MAILPYHKNYSIMSKTSNRGSSDLSLPMSVRRIRILQLALLYYQVQNLEKMSQIYLDDIQYLLYDLDALSVQASESINDLSVVSNFVDENLVK